jgi:hypothetical protein
VLSRSSGSQQIVCSRQFPGTGFPRCRAATSEQNGYRSSSEVRTGNRIIPLFNTWTMPLMKWRSSAPQHLARPFADEARSVSITRRLANRDSRARSRSAKKQVASVWNQNCLALAAKLMSFDRGHFAESRSAASRVIPCKEKPQRDWEVRQGKAN